MRLAYMYGLARWRHLGAQLILCPSMARAVSVLSEDEEKENEVDPENGVEGQEDEMNNSHLMEELWDGGKIFGYLNRLSIYVNVLKESSCRRSREESVPGSCRCVDIISGNI